jgi:hypothetical protein
VNLILFLLATLFNKASSTAFRQDENHNKVQASNTQPVGAPTRAPSEVMSTDGRCGAEFNSTYCGNVGAAPCCSRNGWCGFTSLHCELGCQSAYGLCNVAAPTKQPSFGSTKPTFGPTKQATQLVYTAKIHVIPSPIHQYQWTYVLDTIRRVEKQQNLIDLQYIGNPISTSEFNITIKMTFLTTSNHQSGFDTTARLLSQAIATGSFDAYYHGLGTDKETNFTSISYYGDEGLNYQVNPNDISDNGNGSADDSKKSGKLSTGAVVAICVSIAACFLLVVGYCVYQGYFGTTDSAEEEGKATSTKSEQKLSPSEQFVKSELNNHYAVPKSDNVNILMWDSWGRHTELELTGEDFPHELETV